MPEPSPADLAEIDAMIETGAIDPRATRSALEVMASRYLADELRKRERRAARESEGTATKRREAASLAVMEHVREIAYKIADRARTDWTTLLASSFALPSGERITWAAATIDQHAERSAMLENMAARDTETAALHREAIKDIERAGVTTLGETVSAAA